MCKYSWSQNICIYRHSTKRFFCLRALLQAQYQASIFPCITPLHTPNNNKTQERRCVSDRSSHSTVTVGVLHLHTPAFSFLLLYPRVKTNNERLTKSEQINAKRTMAESDSGILCSRCQSLGLEKFVEHGPPESSQSIIAMISHETTEENCPLCILIDDLLNEDIPGRGPTEHNMMQPWNGASEDTRSGNDTANV